MSNRTCESSFPQIKIKQTHLIRKTNRINSVVTLLTFVGCSYITNINIKKMTNNRITIFNILFVFCSIKNHFFHLKYKQNNHAIHRQSTKHTSKRQLGWCTKTQYWQCLVNSIQTHHTMFIFTCQNHSNHQCIKAGFELCIDNFFDWKKIRFLSKLHKQHQKMYCLSSFSLKNNIHKGLSGIPIFWYHVTWSQPSKCTMQHCLNLGRNDKSSTYLAKFPLNSALFEIFQTSMVSSAL